MKLNKQQQRRFEKARIREQSKRDAKRIVDSEAYKKVGIIHDADDIDSVKLANSSHLMARPVSDFVEQGLTEILFFNDGVPVISGYMTMIPTPIFWIREMGFTDNSDCVNFRIVGYDLDEGEQNADNIYSQKELDEMMVSLLLQCTEIFFMAKGSSIHAEVVSFDGKSEAQRWPICETMPDVEPNHFGKFKDFGGAAFDFTDLVEEMLTLAGHKVYRKHGKGA